MRRLSGSVEERNYAKEPLTKKEIEEIVAAAGVGRVLNARHAIAKERRWAEKPPSEAAFVKAAFDDNNLLRRPVLIAHGRAIIGNDEAGIRGALRAT